MTILITYDDGHAEIVRGARIIEEDAGDRIDVLVKPAFGDSGGRRTFLDVVKIEILAFGEGN